MIHSAVPGGQLEGVSVALYTAFNLNFKCYFKTWEITVIKNTGDKLRLSKLVPL